MPKQATSIKNAASAVNPDNRQLPAADELLPERAYSSSVPAFSSTGRRTEGLEDTLGRDGVSSNYRFDLAPRSGIRPNTNPERQYS